MKILFVASGNKKTGVSPIVKAQGNSLKKQGLRIEYYCIRGKGLIGYLKNIPLLRQYIRELNPDLVHAHYGSSAIVAFIAKSSVKIVASFMGDDLLGSNRKDGSITRKSVFMARVCILLADRFFSHSIVKSKQMALKLSTKNISLIPNGVNISVFKPMKKEVARRKLGLSLTETIAIFVSNPSRPEKNFSLAQRAVSNVTSPNIRLLTVNNVNHDELADYYNAADVLLLTSYHEGSPNVIKEAMACNCPIVSTDVGDVRWVMGNTDGCFISSDRTDEFSQQIRCAMEYALTNDRTNGRNRIVKIGLDDESIAKSIIEVYQKVLK